MSTSRSQRPTPRPAPHKIKGELRSLTKKSPLQLLSSTEELTRTDLHDLGFETSEELVQSVAKQLKLPRLQVDEVQIPSELAQLIPRQLAERHRIVPVFAMDKELTVATCDPTRIELFDWLGRELKREILLVISSPAEIRRALNSLYASGALRVVQDPDAEGQVSAKALDEAAPIIDHLFARAVEMRASDIHLEATEKGTCVRFRVDGILQKVEGLPTDLHAALVSRLKVMAQLDISERQAPQDGRIKISKPNGGEIDLRVSTLPTYFGEKVCCRILDNARALLPLSEIGFDPEARALFERVIHTPYGILLVTGPTGSGKSTTLHGALNAIRSPELNIVTVEDPVEYQLPGINQVPVNPKRGMTFAAALRSILRQDPNVILVGEIRDRETAVIAAEAALTGHLVMASMHTNNAVGAITRLIEMGLEPHLVAPSLTAVVAQRLLRRVCVACSERYQPSMQELATLGLPELAKETTFVKGKGCGACSQTGYMGRTAVVEILEINHRLKQLISQEAHEDELAKVAVEQGFRGLRFQALKKLLQGATSAQEVIRVTRE